MTPAELAEIKVLRLQPGDVIIARFDVDVSEDSAIEVKQKLEEEFPGHEVLVCCGFELEVARKSDQEGGG